MRIHKCVLAVGLAVFCTMLAGTLRADTFILQGVTLADGGTITGQFDWNDVSGSYSYTNVDIQITGAGAEAGLVETITSGDTMNPGGLCFSDPPVGQALCMSTASSGLVFIFDQRLTPNNLDPSDPQLASDTICLGDTSCFDGNQSQYTFSNGVSVAITGGLVVNAPEPSLLFLLTSGLLGLGLFARRGLARL